jgi:hypothetical protein
MGFRVRGLGFGVWGVWDDLFCREFADGSEGALKGFAHVVQRALVANRS